MGIAPLGQIGSFIKNVGLLSRLIKKRARPALPAAPSGTNPAALPFPVMLPVPEQERYAPQPRRANERVHYPADHRRLAAKKPGDQIELEDSHQQPVHCPNDNQQ